MRGGIWPPALLCAALGLALAFMPARARLPAIGALALAALLANRLAFPVAWHEAIFAGTWISVVLAALAVHLPRAGLGAALGLAVNTGFWAGAVASISGTPFDLLRALPFGLLAFPGGWLVARRGGIAIKVVSSWLIAVAILVAALPMVQTPGYARDHAE